MKNEELRRKKVLPGAWCLVLGSWFLEGIGSKALSTGPHKKAMKKDLRPYRPQGDGA